jgi:hypothetical protein
VSKEDTNTLAIAWEHKYRVLQGKYNTETRDLRQALMLKDRQAQEHRVGRLELEGKLTQAERTIEGLKQGKKFWQKQAGMASFALCVAAIAVLVLWMLLLDTQRRLNKAMEPSCKVEGEMYYADPEVITAPPAPPSYQL